MNSPHFEMGVIYFGIWNRVYGIWFTIDSNFLLPFAFFPYPMILHPFPLARTVNINPQLLTFVLFVKKN